MFRISILDICFDRHLMKLSCHERFAWLIIKLQSEINYLVMPKRVDYFGSPAPLPPDELPTIRDIIRHPSGQILSGNSLASHWGWVQMKQVRLKFEINWVICHKLNLSVEPLVVEILKKWTEASEYFSPPRLITSKNLKDRVEYHLLKPQDTRKVEGRLLSDKNMLTMPPPFSVSLRPHWEVSAGPDRGGRYQKGGGV